MHDLSSQQSVVDRPFRSVHIDWSNTATFQAHCRCSEIVHCRQTSLTSNKTPEKKTRSPSSDSLIQQNASAAQTAVLTVFSWKIEIGRLTDTLSRANLRIFNIDGSGQGTSVEEAEVPHWCFCPDLRHPLYVCHNVCCEKICYHASFPMILYPFCWWPAEYQCTELNWKIPYIILRAQFEVRQVLNQVNVTGLYTRDSIMRFLTLSNMIISFISHWW